MENQTETIAAQRLRALFDDGVYRELQAGVTEHSSVSGVICAYGTVGGSPVCAFSQNRDANGAAVGRRHAEKLAALYALAGKTGVPIVGIHDSVGAYVDGTAEALLAYGEMLSEASKLSGVVPQISVIAGVCAGSASLLACSSDFVILTEGCEFYMAPPFDADHGTAEAAVKAGIGTMVCKDADAAITQVKQLLALLPVNNLAGAPLLEYAPSGLSMSGDAASMMQALADADSVLELNAGFGTAARTALATLGGVTVGIAAVAGGQSMTADDCTKLSRFVRTCDAFQLPIVTLLDTAGFDRTLPISGIRAMTQLVNSYAEATTTRLAVVTGSAIGAAFTAMAGRAAADLVFAWEQAVIAPMAPLTAAEFLWHDQLKGAVSVDEKRQELAATYEKDYASAQAAAEKGAVDELLTPDQTRDALISAMDLLSSKREIRLPKKHNNLPL